MPLYGARYDRVAVGFPYLSHFPYWFYSETPTSGNQDVAHQKEGNEGDISAFGALATALAATIGTGSIVGVATAILAGGPGAVFWMWLTGIFGIATKYSEIFVAIKYRVKDHNGNMLGGACMLGSVASPKTAKCLGTQN